MTNSSREWIVVDMDGNELSRHGSYLDAQMDAAREVARFRRGRGRGSRPGDGAYLPRSVIHEPCGRVRDNPYGTGWQSPGCTHVPELTDDQIDQLEEIA